MIDKKMKVRENLRKGFYDVDYPSINENSDIGEMEDALFLKLKKDVLDAFELTNNEKADKIFFIACRLNNDDLYADSLINVMETLKPLF
jgi:hypothetical protein